MRKLIVDMPKPTNIEFTEHHLKYNDGTEREVYVTDSEYAVPKSMMIVSRTDKQGLITHVNVDFIDASGYEKEELIGKPQYILRHPHMPKSAFQELWETVEKGETWSGAVKNLRKDGGYYWVWAVVKPFLEDGKIVGYHSVRKRLERDKKEEYESLYASMRALD